jgi:hypothetical protein
MSTTELAALTVQVVPAVRIVVAGVEGTSYSLLSYAAFSRAADHLGTESLNLADCTRKDDGSVMFTYTVRPRG